MPDKPGRPPVDRSHRVVGVDEIALALPVSFRELPDREDITDLALELGYSSHSHFTAAFRSALGVTPSDYRRSAHC